MTDPDSLAVCDGCLHDLRLHTTLDGCHELDDLGNRCACELAP